MDQINKNSKIKILLKGDWLHEDNELDGKTIYSVSNEPFVTTIEDDLLIIDDYENNEVNLSYICNGINIVTKVKELAVLNDGVYYVKTESDDYYFTVE